MKSNGKEDAMPVMRFTEPSADKPERQAFYDRIAGKT